MRTLDDVGNGTYEILSRGTATKSGGGTNFNWDYKYEIIEENTMPKLTAMMKRALNEDMQILYKAGYLNGDLKITAKGIEALNTVVFDVYKEKLVAEAKEELENESAV